MNKRKGISLFLVFILILGTTLTGCKKEKAPTDDAGAVSSTPKDSEVEQVLNISLDSEPDSLDVAKASDINSQTILTQVMENLTRLEVDDNGNDVVVPAMAESWEPSDDKLVWIFKLRNAKWSDEKPVTAEDFVYGIQRTLNPETASPVATLLEPLKNAEAIINGDMDVSKVGVEAIDEKTLQVTLEYPCPHFLDLTYDRVMQPQRKDIVEKHGTSYGTEADKLVFNGPFIVSEWVHNSHITFSKNEAYWDEKSVKLDKVNVKIISEESALMGELQNGTMDIADAPSAEWIEKLDKLGQFDKITGFEARSHYMFFNQETELFSNKKIRQAFSVSLDRETIQNDIYQNIHTAAYGWVAPPVDIGNENFRKKAGDPVKELIDENPDPKALFIEGLKELGINKDPSEIEIPLMVPNIEGREFPEYLQQLFNEKLGVNIELDVAEWPVFQERNRQLDYVMGYKSKGGYYNDPMTFLDIWVTNAKIIPTGWSNQEYDDLIKKASLSVDDEERYEIFKRAERILVKEDAAIAPYSYQLINTYVQKYVKDAMLPSFGPILIKYIYIEK